MTKTRAIWALACIFALLVLANNLISCKSTPGNANTSDTIFVADPGVIDHIAPEDISDFSKRLEYVGPVLMDDNYHFWGASPIWGPDGNVHLFASRWPVDTSKKENDFWGLLQNCELAHYIADHPQGPFTFSDVALRGTGIGSWDSEMAHNPDIKKVGDQ